jgi:DNA-binding MarR family transcriptional regulator
VQLTKSGRQLIDLAYSAHIANEEKMLTSLSQAERSQLAQLLQRWLVANE